MTAQRMFTPLEAIDMLDEALLLVDTLPGLHPARRRVFHHILCMLFASRIGGRSRTRGPAYVCAEVLYPPVDEHALAAEFGCTVTNIRMARMRGKRFMEAAGGGWVHEFARAVRAAQGESDERDESERLG